MYNTRNAELFQLPVCRANICQFSIRYQGSKLFNSHAAKIVNCATLKLFTAKLKNIFIFHIIKRNSFVLLFPSLTRNILYTSVFL